MQGHGLQGPGRDSVATGAPIGWKLERRQRMHQEGCNGIRDQDVKEQLHLRKKRTSGRIFMKTVELEVAKQIVGTSIRLWKMSDLTLWRGRPPPK
jgi:hypothetical protein